MKQFNGVAVDGDSFGVEIEHFSMSYRTMKLFKGAPRLKHHSGAIVDLEEYHWFEVIGSGGFWSIETDAEKAEKSLKRYWNMIRQPTALQIVYAEQSGWEYLGDGLFAKDDYIGYHTNRGFVKE